MVRDRGTNEAHQAERGHRQAQRIKGAIGNLDPASPTRAHDILTWIEAILEDPRVVLQKQTDRAKTEKMGELKAAGVPFEERIAALEAEQQQLQEAIARPEFYKDGAQAIKKTMERMAAVEAELLAAMERCDVLGSITK